jgi:hypothetical protein
MNTEDKFYFGKHGQPERFERRMTSQELGHLRNWISNHARNTDEAVSAMGKMQRIFEDDPEFWEDKGWSAVARAANVLAFSRPGQPERFDKDIPIKSWTRGSTKYEAGITEDAGRFQPYVNMPESGILVTRSAPTFKSETGARKWLESYMQKMNASRPGQPKKFDASSLDRKGFAAASSSPMLGKLLSEKQMPEGGWRAVETGGNALVISFEDGDVAGNFARRVASHGYSATAPVQSIGRYWNVEVKNG